ncbi:MAG: zinc-binding dehydrogenase, partial [Actinomycetales bacterium]|nr:zinc-binding dehydrogenase [Actinomycetales bacterium]
MRVVSISSPGGSEVLGWTEAPSPVPGPGELLLEVAAAGVNRGDILQREGRYPAPEGAPEWPGLEASGRVLAVGPGASRYRPGDAVCALLLGGGYAERVTVHESLALPVPDGVSLRDAAALPEAAATAWSNLVDVARLAPGETVLVHGGSGGVGSFAVQLAAALGARVIATARDEARCARVRELGADVAIRYADDDVPAAVLRATDSRGVDVVLDVLGA